MQQSPAAGGFRDAAQATGISASSLSGAVKRLEGQLGVRLLNRTTRSVVTTEAGGHLLERLQAAMADVEEVCCTDQVVDANYPPILLVITEVGRSLDARVRASDS